MVKRECNFMKIKEIEKRSGKKIKLILKPIEKEHITLTFLNCFFQNKNSIEKYNKGKLLE